MNDDENDDRATGEGVDFFYLIEKEKLDDEAFMLPYFRGGLTNVADEAVFASDDNGSPLSFAIITMKYKGENIPTVLGTYTLPSQRGHGFGTQVLLRAIERLLERGAPQVLVEFKSDAGKRSFEKDTVRAAGAVQDRRHPPPAVTIGVEQRGPCTTWDNRRSSFS